MKATGLLDVYGFTAACVAADAGCKAANVTLEVFDRNKPANADALPVPLLVTVKFRGNVADVTAAVEAAELAAKQVSGVVTKHVIPAPDETLDPMLKISGLDKD